MRPFVPKGWTGEYLLVGEGPGEHEDEYSFRPFTGAAGRLLGELCDKCGIGILRRALVNAVRCRPPGNRAPSMTEIRACRPFLLRVIEVLRPKFVVALGGTALSALRNSGDNNITKARGRLLTIPGADDTIAWSTYHPSAVLRGNTQYLSKIEEDLVRTWGAALYPNLKVPGLGVVGLDTEFAPDGRLLTIGIADGVSAVAFEVDSPSIPREIIEYLDSGPQSSGRFRQTS